MPQLMREVLMCPPTHFDVRYAINPWMNRDPTVSVNHVRALEQWTALARLVGLHARVRLIDPGLGLPDMCFTANAGFIYANTFVCSRFLHGERRGEEANFREWFRSHGYTCERLENDIVFEGAGDALLDPRGHVWMGHGQRSSSEAAPKLASLLGIEVIGLRLVDPRFYHLDTCLCPLANGSVLYFPGAFDEESVRVIEERFDEDKRLTVSEADAVQFACNVVDLGDTVILNAVSEEGRSKLERSGLLVRQLDLTEFLKSGGAAKCLVLPLWTGLPGTSSHPASRDELLQRTARFGLS